MQNLIFFKLVCSLLPDAFILCFSGPKSKNGDFYFEPGRGFPKIWQPLHNMQESKKERVKVCFFPSFFPLFMFGLNLRHMVMPHMCCEMQNKRSKTRVSPLGSMG